MNLNLRLPSQTCKNLKYFLVQDVEGDSVYQLLGDWCLQSPAGPSCSVVSQNLGVSTGAVVRQQESQVWECAGVDERRS